MTTSVFTTRREKILDILSTGDKTVADLAEPLGRSCATIKGDLQELQKDKLVFRYRQKLTNWYTLDSDRAIANETPEQEVASVKIREAVLKAISNGDSLTISELRRKAAHHAQGMAFSRVLDRMVIAGELKKSRARDNRTGNTTFFYGRMERSLIDQILAPMPTFTGKMSMHGSIDDYHTQSGLTVKSGTSYGVANYDAMAA